MSSIAPGLPPAPPREPRDHDAYRLLGIHVQAWVLANINMADNKAGFVAFGTAALAAYLRPEVGVWLAQPVWGAEPILRVLAMALVLSGSICALIVIAPRARGPGRSLSYWGGIAAHGSPAEYVQAVQRHSADELGRVLLEQSYVISQLAVRKYQWLRLAVWLAAAGFLLVLVAALLP